MTACRSHCPMPLSSWHPRSSNSIPEPATRSFTVRETSTSPPCAAAQMRAPIESATPATFASWSSHSPVWIPARMSTPRGRTASIAAWAQRIARAGPSKVAKKPSPAVSRSCPRKWASWRRTEAWWRASRSRQARSPRSVASRLESTMSVNRSVVSTLSGIVGAASPAESRSELVDDLEGKEDPPIVAPRHPHRARLRDQGSDAARLLCVRAGRDRVAVEHERRCADCRVHLAQIGLVERAVQLVAHRRARADPQPVREPAPALLARRKRRADKLQYLVAQFPGAPALAEVAQRRLIAAVGAHDGEQGWMKKRKRGRLLRIGRREQRCHQAALVRTEDQRPLRPDGAHHRADVLHPRLQSRKRAAPVGQARAALVEQDEPKRLSQALVKRPPVPRLPPVNEVRAIVRNEDKGPAHPPPRPDRRSPPRRSAHTGSPPPPRNPHRASATSQAGYAKLKT